VGFQTGTRWLRLRVTGLSKVPPSEYLGISTAFKVAFLGSMDIDSARSNRNKLRAAFLIKGQRHVQHDSQCLFDTNLARSVRPGGS
jgi:hypothetical protein